MAKSLSINGFESEVIPSSALVAMEIRRLAREQEKPVTVTVGKVPPVKGEGRAMKGIGKVLLVFGSLYFLIHIIAWWAKP